MNMLCVGTLAIDSVETPAGKRERVLGGSASYFAYAAGFYTRVRLLGRTGNDWPEDYTRSFQNHGVDWRGVTHDSLAKSYFWRGRYEQDYQDRQTLEIQMHGFDRYRPCVPDFYADSEIVFLAAAIPTVQRQVLDQCSRAKLVFADTVDMWIDTTRSELLQVLAKIDGLFINDVEAKQLTGKSNYVQAARSIQAMGPRWVILKKGEHGCFVLGPDLMLAIPAYPSDRLIDPTGAGDSFAGGLLGHLCANMDPEILGERSTIAIDRRLFVQALKQATAIASFTIESFSIERLQQITRQDIENRVAQIDLLMGHCG
jgi:sugar/nucleoside kinase (ribokinase family)